jgi:hypothetical protein
VCVLTALSLPLVIGLATPDLFQTLTIIQYNVMKHVLILTYDIESNPGPSIPLKVMFTNINSLLAEKGSRFSELEMRLNTDDTQVA